MKNFLKSAAIFACTAFLFCACSEDDTVDLDIPLVDPSTITAVLSGDSRALIQWEVPDDQNITECMVSWKNNKNVNEVEYVPVIPGYTAELEFFDLTEGDYDLTIINLGENRTVIDVEGASLEGTYIYSADTYPNRPNVMRVLTESDAITITWSQIPQHCRGVYITYTDTLNVSKTTPLQSAVVNPTEITTSVGTTTVMTQLNDAKPGSDFYYVTTFKPLDGLDTVYLAASATPSVISEYVASNPENIVIQAGCNPEKYYTYSDAGVGNDGQTNGGGSYLKVKWKVPSGDSIIYSKVYYNLLDDNGSVVAENSLVFGMEGDSLPTTSLYTATYKENDNITQGNVNTRYIEIAEQGNYQIFVQNMKKGGLVSDMVEADQYYLAYNADTFEFPEAYEALNNLGTLSITWYDVPEHFVTMDMSYTNTSDVACVVSQTANTDGEFDTSLLPGIEAGTVITLIATYLPEDGLESVVITSTEGDGSVVSPDLAPETPTSAITLNPGYSEERGAYVRARWSMNWPDDGGKYDAETFTAHSLRLYYGDVNEKTKEYVAIADLDTEEWYVENLNPDITYEFYLVSVTEDNVTVSAKVTETVDTYDINSYTIDDCPSAKAVLLSGVLTFAWETDFDEALTSVTFTFSGSTMTTVKDAYGWLNSTTVDGTGYDSNAKYVYNYAVFCPEGGLDDITVDISESCSIVVPDIVYSYTLDKCLIYTNAGMKAFADLVNGSKNYSAQTWCEDGTFPSFGTSYTYLNASLTCDVDISSYCAESAYGWTPMGSSSGTYTGTFDGAGYTISGLVINRGTSAYQGLFGYISGATIKDLTLESPAVYGGNATGAIAGIQNYSGGYSTIENCHVVGGYVYNNAGDGTANSSIGSIVGNNNGGIVKDCTSSATVYIPIDQGSNNSTSGTGGIVGYNHTSTKYGQIVGCTFNGYVQGKISTGGIVASNSGGYVAGCVNNGEVRGSSYTGGIVGFNTSSGVTVACIHTGEVYATGRITGGLVGRQAAYMYGCYSTGVLVDESTYQLGIITGYSNASANTTSTITLGNYFMYQDVQKQQVVDFLKTLISDNTLYTAEESLDFNVILDPDNVDDDDATSMPIYYYVNWGLGSDSANVAGANVTGVATEVTTIAGMNTAVNAMNTAGAYTNWSGASTNLDILYTYYFLPGTNVSTDLPYPVLND